jgi:hypothetical protein
MRKASDGIPSPWMLTTAQATARLMRLVYGDYSKKRDVGKNDRTEEYFLLSSIFS